GRNGRGDRTREVHGEARARPVEPDRGGAAEVAALDRHRRAGGRPAGREAGDCGQRADIEARGTRADAPRIRDRDGAGGRAGRYGRGDGRGTTEGERSARAVERDTGRPRESAA